MAKKKYDVIIVGAGHNSLACGGRLAKVGGIKNILVLEKHPSILGGCSRTDPNIFPGYKVDTGAQALYGAARGCVKALGLEEFGCEPIELVPNFYWLLGEGKESKEIPVYPDINLTIKEIEKYSKEEAANYRRLFDDSLPFVANVLSLQGKPDVTSTQLMQVLETVGKDAMYMYLSRASEILRSYFKTDWMIGGIARLILASNLDPRWPTSGWMVPGSFSFTHLAPFWRAKGGMGNFVGAMAKLIEHNGGEVRLNAGVKKIIIENGQAKGVRLESGEEIEGDIIVSGTHFKISYFDLVGKEHLDPKFVTYLERQVEGYSGLGVFLTLDQEPEFGGKGCAMTAGGLRDIEDTFEAFSRNVLPPHPSLWLNNPCIVDPTLAPPGKYWVSFFAIVPCTLAGTTWAKEKEPYAEKVLDAAARRIPNLKRHIINRYIQNPVDIERDMNVPGASVMGPVMTLDQMWSMRPPIRSPIKNLYMTGTGVHPGGGVSGTPGFNTARVILADLEKKKGPEKKKGR
jgi:phytoene dehydrogenase-like protein